MFAKIGLTTPPCGVPRLRSILVPSSCTIDAVSHLSMYSSAHLHVTCFRTARSKSSWLMLWNMPFLLNSNIQAYFLHCSRVSPTAYNLDFLRMQPFECARNTWSRLHSLPLLPTI